MAAAGAAAVACIVGVGALVLALGGDLNPGAQDVGDGRVAVVQNQANASLRVIGPERVLVGETALYRFETANVESVTWIDPAGRVWSEPLLEVEASSTGRGTVTAVGVDPAGGAIRAELNFEATTPE